MFWQGLVSIVAWFALMFLSTNLVGILLRGLISQLLAADKDGQEGAMDAKRESNGRGIFLTAIGISLSLTAISYFGNFALAIAALMLMISRLPDLFWEVRKGRQLEMEDMSRTPFPILSSLLSWAALPVVWYSLYQM
jgi:hypothetical protein